MTNRDLCDAFSQEEATVSQLRDILVFLEISVAAILQDSVNLREEVSQCGPTFQSHGGDIDQVKTKLGNVMSENLYFDTIRIKAKKLVGRVLKKLIIYLDVEISSTDIEFSHKIKQKSKTCIIAKFISHKIPCTNRELN